MSSVDGGRFVLYLNISRVVAPDGGWYRCEAANAFGSDAAQFQLTVQELPKAPEQLKILKIESRTAELEWLDGNTDPLLEYRIDLTDASSSYNVNRSVEAGRNAVLLQDLRPFTTYQVQVSTINSAGIGPPSPLLPFQTLEEAPSGSPKYVLAESKSSRSILVSWLAPSEDTWNGRLVTFQIQCKEQNGAKTILKSVASSLHQRDPVSIRHQVLMERLRPATLYVFTVRAVNRIGSGPQSESISLTTPDAAPSGSPLDVGCVTLSSDAVQVTWASPTSTEHNGFLQGFRIFYRLEASAQLSDSFRRESKRVGNTLHSALHGLQAFRNYSIQISALNRAGKGPLSAPVTCQTDQSVAGVPQNVKVLSLSSTSLLVVWRRPSPPNGKIAHYTVSIKDTVSKETKRFNVDDVEEPTHQVGNLLESRLYHVTVSATTKVGESRPSPILSASPAAKSGVKIAEFSRTVFSEKQLDVILPCTAIGSAPVERHWTLKGKPLDSFLHIGFHQDHKDGTLHLLDVSKNFEGEYVCAVKNAYGRDSIVYTFHLLQVPDMPQLSITSTTTSSISLSWNKPMNKLPLLELVIFYRQYAGGVMQEKVVDGMEDATVIQDLLCGTQYELQIQARNQVGTGSRSAILRAMTRGSGPLAPQTDALTSSVASDPSTLILHLDHWFSAGCPIHYVRIEKKGPLDAAWSVLTSSVDPDDQPMFKLHDFAPDDVYHLKLTASTDAGSQTVLYTVQRLSQRSGTFFDVNAVTFPSVAHHISYESMIVVTSMSISALMLLFSVTAIIYVVHKRQQFQQAAGKSEYSLRTVSEQLDDQLNGRSLRNNDASSYSLRKQVQTTPVDYDDDDITPYATFTLKPICGMDTSRSLMSVPSIRAPDSHSSNSIEADVYGQGGLHPTLPLCMHSGNNPQIYRHLNRSPVPPYRHTSDTSDSLYSDTYSTKNVYSSRKKYRTPNQRTMAHCEVLKPPYHFTDLGDKDDLNKFRF